MLCHASNVTLISEQLTQCRVDGELELQRGLGSLGSPRVSDWLVLESSKDFLRRCGRTVGRLGWGNEGP